MARPRQGDSANYQVRALERGLAILRAFTPSEPRLGLAELSRRLEIPKSTTLRLVEALRAEGFLAYDAGAGTYSLGLRTFEVGSVYLATSTLEQRALPLLQRLMKATNLTANLGVLDGHEVVHLSVVQPDRPLRYHTHIGARDHLHCTALGKILAAHLLDAHALKELVTKVGLPARTPATITDPAAFRAELARVSRLGYAEDREETVPGLRCLGAPVRGHTGQVLAALSISGPAADFQGRNRERLLSSVVETATALSEQLGWSEVKRDHPPAKVAHAHR